jgi:hypothetical protein
VPIGKLQASGSEASIAPSGGSEIQRARPGRERSRHGDTEMMLFIGAVLVALGLALVWIAMPNKAGVNPAGALAELLYPVLALGVLVLGASLLLGACSRSWLSRWSALLGWRCGSAFL